MMAGNPNWWIMRSQAQQTSAVLSPSLFPHQYVSASSSSLPLNSLVDNHEFPQSWSQLLMGGLVSEEEDKFGVSHFQFKKVENWEEQILINPSLRVPVSVVDVKQEVGKSSRQVLYSHGDDDQFQTLSRPPSWSHRQVMPVSSPRSCVTSLSSNNNILDFSNNNKSDHHVGNQHPNHSSECNSTATGRVSKKARVQSSSTLPPLKVRKEKLGDRITALHQLVSPFGKTDTASVLLEAIGYIGFLQGQIEALSSPYLASASANMRHNQQSVQNDRNSGTFREDYGDQQGNCQDAPTDLRSRGLCLVPVSCTHQIGSDNGADYWAPAIGGGF